MSIPKHIETPVSGPFRAPSNYDPLPPHPGLVAPTDDPPRTPDNRNLIHGHVVADHDVFDSYPDAIKRDFEILDITNAQARRRKTAAVFQVDDAVVTRGYTTIDPALGYLFVNHSYESLLISRQWTATSKPGPFALSLQRVTDIAGTVIVIGGPYDENYYHALLNWFGRLALLDLLAPGHAADASVKYLIDGRARREPFASMLAALGIDTRRIIWSEPTLDYRIEHAILLSFFHEGIVAPEIVRATVATIRSNLGIESDATGRRRIWISREHFTDARRRIHNMDDIAPILDRHDFERIILEDLSFAEQVELFSQASIVAGSHGAGFSNSIFCPAGGRLVTIEKDVTRYLGISNIFPNLAELAGVRSEIVPAASVFDEQTDYSKFINAHFADASVDPDLVEAAILRAISASEPGTEILRP